MGFQSVFSCIKLLDCQQKGVNSFYNEDSNYNHVYKLVVNCSFLDYE